MSGALSAWKLAVKRRDGFACKRCGSTDHLHAHHIVPFADNQDIATDVANGETLCDLCHSIEHGRWIGTKSRAHLFKIKPFMEIGNDYKEAKG
jgi:5-methylcytosine-specific restriction endonuclease McrA